MSALADVTVVTAWTFKWFGGNLPVTFTVEGFFKRSPPSGSFYRKMGFRIHSSNFESRPDGLMLKSNGLDNLLLHRQGNEDVCAELEMRLKVFDV